MKVELKYVIRNLLSLKVIDNSEIYSMTINLKRPTGTVIPTNILN